MPSLSEQLHVDPPCSTCKSATFIHGDPFCELTNGLVDCPHLKPDERARVDAYERENHLEPIPAIDEAIENMIHSLKKMDVDRS